MRPAETCVPGTAATQDADSDEVLTLTVRVNILEAMFRSKTYGRDLAPLLDVTEQEVEAKLDNAADLLSIAELRIIADATGVGLIDLVRPRPEAGELL